MEPDVHELALDSVCLCGKKAFRLLSQEDKTKINSVRDDSSKINFDLDYIPRGVCKRCEPSVRLKGRCVFAFWKAHATLGNNYRTSLTEFRLHLHSGDQLAYLTLNYPSSNIILCSRCYFV